jgi:hypothetical protein
VEKALGELDGQLVKARSSPEQWRDAVQLIAPTLLALQYGAAAYADAYLNDVLDAQNEPGDGEARVNPDAFVDLADGGGSWAQTLVFAPNSVRPKDGDWSRFDFVARSIVKTGLGDTARAAVQSGMQARPAVTGYVRQLRGKSCARCAVLAGKRYRSAVAFNRHERCDCVNVPCGDGTNSWATSPKTHFRTLSPEDQDRLFTKAGAEAIRAGADIAQVVNARQGIKVVQAYGRDLQTTTVGTVRGLASARIDGRYRLLPDEIFQQAERLGWDRAQIAAQLRRYAYLV